MSDQFVTDSTKIIQRLQEQLQQIRTGRAQPALVENISVLVESYGGMRMPLKELASIMAPDPSLLVIQPFDPNVVKDIEKSLLLAHELGISPAVKDKVIHIVIPPLTQERRLQMVDQVHKRLEETRIALRNLRTDVKQFIESQKGAAGVSEDDIKHQIEQLQKSVDSVMKQVDALGLKKEEELTQI